MMQKFYGTSYGAQEKSRILDLATLGDGYKMNDGGYFSLNNGKVTRTDYTTNNFNYLTGRVHNADGTVSETYSSGSYVSSISKPYGEFNAAEVYGNGNNFSYLKTTESNSLESAIAIPFIGAVSKIHPVVKFGTGAYIAGYYAGMNIEATTNGIAKFLVFLGVNADYLYGNYDSFAKSKRGKQSARQEEVKHGGPSVNVKGRGAKGDKHTKRRPGDLGDKKRRKAGWTQK